MQITETFTKSKKNLSQSTAYQLAGRQGANEKKKLVVLTTDQACGKVRHVSQSGWFSSGANFMYLPMENTSASLMWYLG